VKKRSKGKSRRTVIIEHRLGRDGGAYTDQQLFQKLGLESSLTSQHRKLIREDTYSEEALGELVLELKSAKKKKMKQWVGAYKTHLKKFYLPQNLRPIFTNLLMVRDGEIVSALFIQGLIELDTHELVVGEPEDLAEGVAVTGKNNRKGHQSYVLSQKIAGRMLEDCVLTEEKRLGLENLVKGKPYLTRIEHNPTVSKKKR